MMFVVCPECGKRHSNKEIKATDIAEDFQGRDVITYICPVTGNETKSLVYVKR